MLMKEGREEMKIKTFVQYKLGKCLSTAEAGGTKELALKLVN